MDKKTVKAIADKEVSAHEKRMHEGTKKFAKGGVTSANAKKFGRNLARAKNQSGG
jgi:hypothetical protein